MCGYRVVCRGTHGRASRKVWKPGFDNVRCFFVILEHDRRCRHNEGKHTVVRNGMRRYGTCCKKIDNTTCHSRPCILLSLSVCCNNCERFTESEVIMRNVARMYEHVSGLYRCSSDAAPKSTRAVNQCNMDGGSRPYFRQRSQNTRQH